MFSIGPHGQGEIYMMRILLLFVAIPSVVVKIYTERNKVLFQLFTQKAVQDPIMQSAHWNIPDGQVMFFGASHLREDVPGLVEKS